MTPIDLGVTGWRILTVATLVLIWVPAIWVVTVKMREHARRMKLRGECQCEVCTFRRNEGQ